MPGSRRTLDNYSLESDAWLLETCHLKDAPGSWGQRTSPSAEHVVGKADPAVSSMAPRLLHCHPHIGGVPGTVPLSQNPQPQSKGAEAPLTICAGDAGVRLHQSQRDTTRALTSPLRVCALGQEGPGGHCSGGEGLHKAGAPRPFPSRESDP